MSDCPIAEDVSKVQTLSKDITQAIRKLRRDLNACQHCPSFESCVVLQNFNSLVRECLLEIQAEWELES